MTSPYPPQNPYPPQPGYAPQQGYAPAPGYAPQGYGPQAGGYAPAPGYPPQNFAPQAQYAPPAAPPITARGTIEDFLDQAGGGGQSVTKFFTDERVNGHWLQLTIARDLMQSDVRPQLDNNKQQARDQQGRPKWVLVIQCTVLGSSDGSHQHIFPDGACSIWLKGLTKEGLVAAMSTAGVQKPDHALLNGKLGGAGILMQSAGTRAARTSGFSAAKLYNFQYTPNGREMEAADPTATQTAPAMPAAPTAPAPSAAAPVAPQQYQQAPPQQPQFAAPPAPSTPPLPPTPGAPAPGAPQGYAPQPGYEQMAQPAPTQQYQQAPPAPPAPQYAQQAPPAPGYAPAPPVAPQVPQGYAPPSDPEKAATLARIQGLGG